MVASGLKSKIIGEDQIITQIKNAVDLSRNINFLDTLLDVLFRNAITASKKIKTEIKLKKTTYSVIDSAIKKLDEIGINIAGKKCLIIGNGEMGRLTATTLIKNNAYVTMTLRQHHKQDIILPSGVETIKFTDRIKNLPQFDIVFSTTSTNSYMLKYEDVSKIKFKQNIVFIDLAVPRDIESKIFEMEGVLGFNIDSFEIDKNDLENFEENMLKAKNILDKYIQNFYKWYFNKDFNTTIFQTSQKIANDTLWRLGKKLRDENISENIEIATKKSVEKFIFSLKDTMDNNQFKNFIETIEKSYLEREEDNEK